MCSLLDFLSTLCLLITAMCNHTSYAKAQVYELQWGYWQTGNNQEGTLSEFLTIYIYVYMYIYICVYMCVYTHIHTHTHTHTHTYIQTNANFKCVT